MTGSDAIAALYADEIGILYAVHGDALLRSQYRPIHALRGAAMVPVAAEARLVVARSGETYRLGVADGRDWPMNEGSRRACLEMLLFNRVFTGASLESIFVAIEPEEADCLLCALVAANQRAESLGEEAVEPKRVVARLSRFPVSQAELAGLDTLSKGGVSVAVDGFAFAEASLRMPEFRPAVAEIAGPRLAELRRYPEATKLLAPLVASFKKQGAKVAAHGLASPGELRNAIDAGVDRFSGALLASPLAAGMEFDIEGRALDTLLPERRLRLVSARM